MLDLVKMLKDLCDFFRYSFPSLEYATSGCVETASRWLSGCGNRNERGPRPARKEKAHAGLLHNCSSFLGHFCLPLRPVTALTAVEDRRQH